MNTRTTIFNQTLDLLLAFFFALTLVFLFALLLNYSIEQQIGNHLELLRNQFIEGWRSDVNPKPKERLIYLILLTSLPLFCFISIKTGRVISCLVSKKNLIIILSTLLVISTALIPYFFYSSVYIMSLITLLLQHQFALSFILLASFCYYLSLHKKQRSKLPKKLQTIILTSIIIFGIVFQSVSFRIYNLYSTEVSTDFEIAIYSITQVFAGKTMLADLMAQYGMYSELLNPVFKLIGLNIFKITFIFAILQITGLLALFFVSLRLIRNRLLILFTMATLLTTTGTTWALINLNYHDPYFQIYPIRFFFPAIATLLLFKLCQRVEKKWIFLLAFVSSLAVMWNLDTGVPIFLTFILYLFSYMFFPTPKIECKTATKLILLSVSIFFTCIGMFLIYLQWKARQPLHFSWLYKSQHIYFQSGFFNLNIPTTLDPWQIFYAFYLFTMLGAIFIWLQGKRNSLWDFLFCLSILGQGIFSYYEFRSHPWVLIQISWPIILMIFILCDRSFRLARLNIMPRIFTIINLPILFFGMLMLVNFIYGIPKLYQFGLNQWQLSLKKENTPTSRNLLFIQSNLPTGSNAIVLSVKDSLYYAELGSKSMLQPSAGEYFLMVDRENLRNQLSESIADTIFIEPSQLSSLNENLVTDPTADGMRHLDLKYNNKGFLQIDKLIAYLYPTILKNYTIVKISQDGMFYLKRKPLKDE